jgi:hypothetical protein
MDSSAIQTSPLPQNRSFSEQTQRAFRPALSLRGKAITGFIISGISLILAIVSIVSYNSSHEYEQRYDDICPVGKEEPCVVDFTIPDDLSGRISFSYKLTNFHQNHRRFLYSRNAEQLQGAYVPYADLSSCYPYRSVDDSPDPEKWILPSGTVSRFIFNDTIIWDNDTTLVIDYWAITFDTEWSWTYMPLSEEYKTGIKWMRNNTVFPLSFDYPEQDPNFIRWMRTEATQTVVKEIWICKNCSIRAGVYPITIISRYPTSIYGGTKSFILTEASSLGDRSFFLGVLLIVISCLVLAFTAFLILAEFVFAPQRSVVSRGGSNLHETNQEQLNDE